MDPAHLRVSHIVADLAKAGGGPSYTVPALSSALAALGDVVRLHSVARDRCSDCSVSFSGIEVAAHPADMLTRPLRGSTTLYRSLRADAANGAILHAHGLWLLPNLYPAWIKQAFPDTLVVHSPRGMLAPAAMQISTWKKKPVWHLWQKLALQKADCLHATAMSEYEEIRALGLRKPVAVIRNGIDVPPLAVDHQRGGRAESSRTILSVGRLHPKKALDVLVRAWSSLESSYPAWSVRIVGPAEGRYDEQLRQLARGLGLERLSIEGPVYNGVKLATYRAADLFVLPTLNENFGVAVAEALAAEVPVISTKGAPWSGLVAEGCGWWIDHGVEPLVHALRTAMEMPSLHLAEMGRKGRNWMERDFSWSGVATEMRAVYAWLRGEGPMPTCIEVA